MSRWLGYGLYYECIFVRIQSGGPKCCGAYLILLTIAGKDNDHAGDKEEGMIQFDFFIFTRTFPVPYGAE